MSKKEKYNDIDDLDELQDEELVEEEFDSQTEDGDEEESKTEGTEKEDKKSRRRRVMQALLNNEGETNITSAKDLFKSINLNGEWFRRNLLFIIVITACLLGFVTNRYQAQQELIEEANLKKELTRMKYKWLTRYSELTTCTRESRIEEQLRQNGDTTLKHSKDAPFLIKADK